MYFPEQFILVAKVRNGVLEDNLMGEKHTATADLCEEMDGKVKIFKVTRWWSRNSHCNA